MIESIVNFGTIWHREIEFALLGVFFVVVGWGLMDYWKFSEKN